VVGKQAPGPEGECDETEAAKRGAISIDAGRLPATLGSAESFALLLLALMFLYQRCACGQDRGKGEKEAAENRTREFGNDARGRGPGCLSSRDGPDDRHVAKQALELDMMRTEEWIVALQPRIQKGDPEAIRSATSIVPVRMMAQGYQLVPKKGDAESQNGITAGRHEDLPVRGDARDDRR
jgi:hypothetical protein